MEHTQKKREMTAQVTKNKHRMQVGQDNHR